MTNEEINKYIHEQIMEKCVHDRKYLGHFKYRTGDEQTSIHDLQAHGKYACNKCPDVSFNGGNDNGRCPDYCSDSSPRSLLNDVVANIEDSQLYEECLVGAYGYNSYYTAEQIARACVEAHKNN